MNCSIYMQSMLMIQIAIMFVIIYVMPFIWVLIWSVLISFVKEVLKPALISSRHLVIMPKYHWIVKYETFISKKNSCATKHTSSPKVTLCDEILHDEKHIVVQSHFARRNNIVAQSLAKRKTHRRAKSLQK